MGRPWQLVTLEGSPPIEEVTINLTLDEEQVSGSAGCNRYTGPANVSGTSLTLGPDLATTRMACPEEIMSQETKFLDALARATSYRIANDRLTLIDDNEVSLAVFE